MGEGEMGGRDCARGLGRGLIACVILMDEKTAVFVERLFFCFQAAFDAVWNLIKRQPESWKTVFQAAFGFSGCLYRPVLACLKLLQA